MSLHLQTKDLGVDGVLELRYQQFQGFKIL